MALIIVGFIVVLGIMTLSEKAQASTPSFDLRARVKYWADLRGLNPAHVWGVVMQESGGNPTVKNPDDPSSGLMGVTPLIGKYYGGLSGTDAFVLERLLEVETNLKAGTGFMKHLQARYGASMAFQEWIQAYNCGETNFDRGFRVPKYGSGVASYAGQWKDGE
jgi:soluble lytic murein transglycosylase-like protein